MRCLSLFLILVSSVVIATVLLTSRTLAHEIVSAEAAKSKKPPPSSTSLANAFAARPHGNVATTASSQLGGAGGTPRSFSDYLHPSPKYQEAFDELASGNTTAVRRLQQLADDEGDGHAQMLLGVLFGAGVAVPRDKARSKLYHSFAALNGISESTIALALEAEEGFDCEEALPLAKRAADVSARFNSDGSITPRWDASRLTTIEEKEATATESEFDIQLLLAERGDARASCQVGYAYMLGLHGIEQDGLAAQTYFERGMQKEEPACFSGMGQLYARGVVGGAHPVARNPQLAAKYYKQGAQLNHHPSLNGLGYLHAAGALSPTGERDFEGAATWFDKSASLNSPSGLYNMGLLYLNGKGVPQDSFKAFEKFGRAASMGSLLATYQLGNMFAVGAGPVAKNCRSSLSNFNLVQRLGPWNLRWNYARTALRNHHPGEALLHYLILGAIGRAKASQNAMFIIERFFDDSHPLVSFNGSSTATAGETTTTAKDQAEGKNSVDAGAGSTSYRSVLLHRLVLDAAKNGGADAKLDLATHYWDGIGTPRNRILAKEAYHAAANEGNAEAMYMLGWLHSTAFEEIYQDEEEMLLRQRKQAEAEEEANDNEEQSQQLQVQDQEQQQVRKNAGKRQVRDGAREDDEFGPRKRRIMTNWKASPSSPSLSASSLDAGASSSSANAIVGVRGHRDFALAKRNYDRTLQQSPQAWFAVKLALLRLNFLEWYDHFFQQPDQASFFSPPSSRSSSSSPSPHQQKSSSPSSFSNPQSSSARPAEQQQHSPTRTRMSLKQTYTVLRKLALEVLQSIDPVVMSGFSLSDILMITTVGMLICLLLIRHHAFGV